MVSTTPLLELQKIVHLNYMRYANRKFENWCLTGNLKFYKCRHHPVKLHHRSLMPTRSSLTHRSRAKSRNYLSANLLQVTFLRQSCKAKRLRTSFSLTNPALMTLQLCTCRQKRWRSCSSSAETPFWSKGGVERTRLPWYSPKKAAPTSASSSTRVNMTPLTTLR